MLACHAGGPGSIPGQCTFCFIFLINSSYLKKIALAWPEIEPFGKITFFYLKHSSTSFNIKRLAYQSKRPSYIYQTHLVFNKKDLKKLIAILFLSFFSFINQPKGQILAFQFMLRTLKIFESFKIIRIRIIFQCFLTQIFIFLLFLNFFFVYIM